MKTEAIADVGTRGQIAARSRRHRRQSSLLIQEKDARIMIDCGADWLDQMPSIRPTAIVLTHAHPDRAAGLAKGAPCPVYATKEKWMPNPHCAFYDKRDA
jgi:phosphoribosyl 1,2-cyclic phosphodiesterase